MAPRGRSRRVARAEPAPKPAEEAGQGVPAKGSPTGCREFIAAQPRCSFLMPVPEQLMPFMIEADFGHVIQLRDFAFDAPFLLAFVER
ncbi:hypothetical protein PIB30_004163 [Stylosanthes scabra]|uniref:Uncharacterized protein n=1 Tax=Stylosanthes scabra TaxID=79078 RepID=A0ABU6Q3I4_9FABA|nr:hypothetical protein [Stylosanthes scabra]